MKKLINIILTILVILTLGCSKDAKEAQVTKPNAMKIEDMNIGGIYLGQPMSEVTAKLGKPVKSEPGAPKGIVYLFNKNGAKIWIKASSSDSSGDVMSIGITGDSKLTTKTGIKYGSSVDEIKKVYGDPTRDYRYPQDHPFYKEGIKRVVWFEKEIEKTKAGHYHRLHFSFALDGSDKVFGMRCWEEWD